MVDAATRHGMDRHGASDGGAAPITLLRSGVPPAVQARDRLGAPPAARTHVVFVRRWGRLQAPHSRPMRGARCGASPKQRERRPTGVRGSVHAAGAPPTRWVWLQSSRMSHM